MNNDIVLIFFLIFFINFNIAVITSQIRNFIDILMRIRNTNDIFCKYFALTFFLKFK